MSTNGYALTAEGECPRCDAKGFDTLEALKAHFLSPTHGMSGHQAYAEASMAFRGAAKVMPIVGPSDVPHHTCPKCETKIPCQWETIAQIEHQATQLKMLAARLRDRQVGRQWGAPRRDQTWTDEDVFRAWKDGLSVRALARLFHAGTPTIDKALARAKAGRA